MRKFLSNVVDSNSTISSKRFITLCAFFLIAIGFLSNLYGKFTVDPTIFDAVKWIVIGGLGFTASEQFANKNGDTVSSKVTESTVEIKKGD